MTGDKNDDIKMDLMYSGKNVLEIALCTKLLLSSQSSKDICNKIKR